MIGGLSSVNDLIKDPDLMSEKLQHNSDLSPWKMRGRGRPKHSLSTQRNTLVQIYKYHICRRCHSRPWDLRPVATTFGTPWPQWMGKGISRNQKTTFLGAQVVWGCYNLTGKIYKFSYFLKGYHLILLEKSIHISFESFGCTMLHPSTFAGGTTTSWHDSFFFFQKTGCHVSWMLKLDESLWIKFIRFSLRWLGNILRCPCKFTKKAKKKHQSHQKMSWQ